MAELEHSHHDLDVYGDTGITSGHAPIPKWLIYNYILWPIVGIVVWALYWNGMWGWLDRGYWNELERAANTVYPFNTTQLMEASLKAEAGMTEDEKERNLEIESRKNASQDKN